MFPETRLLNKCDFNLRKHNFLISFFRHITKVLEQITLIVSKQVPASRLQNFLYVYLISIRHKKILLLARAD